MPPPTLCVIDSNSNSHPHKPVGWDELHVLASFDWKQACYFSAMSKILGQVTLRSTNKRAITTLSLLDFCNDSPVLIRLFFWRVILCLPSAFLLGIKLRYRRKKESRAKIYVTDVVTTSCRVFLRFDRGRYHHPSYSCRNGNSTCRFLFWFGE